MPIQLLNSRIPWRAFWLVSMTKRDRASETGNLWYFIRREGGFVAIFPSDDRVVGDTGRGSARVPTPRAL